MWNILFPLPMQPGTYSILSLSIQTATRCIAFDGKRGDQFVIVRDGGQFIESGVRRYVVVETEDLKKLSEDGASFGKL